jgi:PIN domain nuclease of toxin-antitoxin system
MRVLVDSPNFVWAKCAPENLGDDAFAALDDPYNDVFVSLATAWELWIKHAKKPIPGIARVLDAGAHGFALAARESGFDLLEIALDHIAAAAMLPDIHGDPFDRLLIAQAIAERLTIVTHDAVFKRYPGIQVLEA